MPANRTNTPDQSPPAGRDDRAPSRPSKDKQRELAAERQRRYRERQKQQTDPEAYRAEQVARAQAEAEEKARAEADEKAKAERLANVQNILVESIAGATEALAEGVQKVWLEQDGPHLGNARARRIAEGWAPILAPYVNESNMKYLPLILAATGTTGALLQWSGEYAEWQKAHKAEPKKQEGSPVAPA